MPTRFPAPPRRVPLSLRIVNFFNGGTQFGWIFLGVGLIAFRFFGMEADVSFLTFRNADGRTIGQVVRTAPTGASEDDDPVHASHYQYSVAGRVYTGTAYSTGTAPAAGHAVTIEYVEANPARSRVEGMRRAVFGPWILPISAIFPAIGLTVLFFTTRSGMERNRLLRNGILAQGVLKSKRETNMRVNRQMVWELTFEFRDRLGARREVSTRTHLPGDLSDEATEPLLYDPEKPQRAYLLDEAPARPQFDLNGELAGRRAAAIGSLIIPTIVICGWGFLYSLKLGVMTR